MTALQVLRRTCPTFPTTGVHERGCAYCPNAGAVFGENQLGELLTFMPNADREFWSPRLREALQDAIEFGRQSMYEEVYSKDIRAEIGKDAVREALETLAAKIEATPDPVEGFGISYSHARDYFLGVIRKHIEGV